MYEEFDEAEVIELVAQALAEEGEKAFAVKSRLPLAWGDTMLLERLTGVLGKHVVQPDVQMILNDLRYELQSGIEVDPTAEKLHVIARNCRKCPSAIAGSAQIPYWNVSDPDVVFIAEHPMIDKTGMDFFTSTASSVGFTSARLCMTFVNRCKRQEKGRYELGEIKNCIPYLLSEIQILKPKLIVPLGLISLSALLGEKVTLNEERGKIRWLGPWAIMPTYSPSYAVRGQGNLSTTFEQDMQRAFKFVYGE